MGRAPCCDKANVKKGPWSPEEDAKLKSYIESHGTGGNWIALPQKMGLKRCGKSCRLRWLNYLRPNLKHGDFSEEEDNIICSLYITIGSRWSIMAGQLPGRTDNDIKNYWNTKLKKKLFGKKYNSKQQQKPSTSRGGGGARRNASATTTPQPAPPCRGELAPANSSSSPPDAVAAAVSSSSSSLRGGSRSWLSTEELNEWFPSGSARLEELDGVEQVVEYWNDDMMSPLMAASTSPAGLVVHELCDLMQYCWPPLTFEEELQMGTQYIYTGE